MIAIVGKIASGKTRILNYLKRKVYKVLDVDRFIVKLYKSKQFVY
ncbi:hypothetical protein [Mycoplasmopsis cynos]|nr:hypothetical protein [Mycoplasmopsis cynos]WAM07852.1 hypothetical protein ONA21_00465 [Mycoplasmopsis cynos]